MKIKATLHRIWQFIKDAFRPEWIIARTDTVEADQLNMSQDAPDQSSSHDDGTAEHDPREALDASEEITRLQRRIEELEKELTNCGIVMETKKQLQQLFGEHNLDRRGRPPKPHVRVSLNLATQWAILFQLGKNSALITGTMTEFINNAFGYLLQKQYPSLYALYEDSIANKTKDSGSPP